MKFRGVGAPTSSGKSHPARGAWIEIFCVASVAFAAKSHPARGAWIEMSAMSTRGQDEESHPARGAWIEMTTRHAGQPGSRVAPRKGCVD